MVRIEVGVNNWVDLPVPHDFSRADEYLAWAKRHCPSYITNDAVQKEGEYHYRFYFGDERDQIAFALRWS